MKTFKLISALLVLGAVLNCSKISEKVEQKVNEKVNEKIDENLKKVDSTLDRKSLDTLKNKADSIMNEQNDRQTRKTK